MIIISEFGVIPSKYDARDYKLTYTAIDENNLPKDYESPLPSFDKNQGTSGICTNASMSRWFERQYKLKNNIDKEFSQTWLYAHKEDKITSGAQLREILKIANSLGNCENNLFPYVEDMPDIANELNNINVDIVEENSKQNQLKGYARLSSTTDIKVNILKNSYTYIAIPWYESPVVTCDSFSDDSNDYLNVYSPNGNIKGFHAVLIYGWHKDKWKCINTWGNNWENKGRFELSSDYPIIEAWSLIGDCTEPEQKIPDAVKPINPIVVKKSDNWFIQIFWKCINFIINLIKNRR